MKLPRIDLFIWAMFNILWWKLCGRPILVPADVQEERIADCETCDDFEPVSRQCLDCTCFVDGKTWFASEECPKKKWLKYFLPCLLSKRKAPKNRL